MICWFRGFLVVALAFVLSCSSRSTNGWQGVGGSQTPGEARPAQLRKAIFRSDTGFVKTYESPGRPQQKLDRFFSPTLLEVENAAKAFNRSIPVLDGRLSRAAADWARAMPAGAQIPYRMVEFGLQHHGIVEPSPLLIVVQGGDAETIAEELRSSLEKSFAKSSFARVGVGRSPGTNANDRVTVLALQESHLELLPMAKVYESGDEILFRGRIFAPFTKAKVFITESSGTVLEASVRRMDKGLFEAQARCGKSRGSLQVEVTASDRSGSNVLANFPVWCGRSPPSKLAVSLTHVVENGISSQAEAEALMANLVNQERKRAGVPPLVVDLRLTKVSRAYSGEMRRTGNVAHISELSGSPFDRVRASKIGAAVVLENVAQSHGIVESHNGLMNSPAHRVNILSKDVNRIGIGIVQVPQSIGGPQLFITQLFIQVPRAVNTGAMRSKVRKEVEKRSRLLVNAVLDSVAQRAAVRIAGGMSVDEASRQASQDLSSQRTPFRRVTTLVTSTLDPAYQAPDAVRQPSLSHYGAGVAVAPNDEYGGVPTITIVLLLGS